MTSVTDKHDKNELFNGFSNYETWDIALYWDSDSTLYKYQLRLIEIALDNAMSGYNPIDNLANNIQYFTDTRFQAFFYHDLVREDLSMVSWIEIAESMLGDWLLNNGDNNVFNFED